MWRLARVRLAIVLALAGALSASAEEGGSMKVSSSAFAANGAIPARHTCDGADVSPPLAWTAPPAGTKSLALVVDDPDAPDPAAPRVRWVHWVVLGLPADARSLPEAVRGAAELPAGARMGKNDWGKPAWGGPCPPIGRHRYFFTLYALDAKLDELASPTRRALDAAMKGHVLAQAELVGTYERER